MHYTTEIAILDLYRAGSAPADYDVEYVVEYERYVDLDGDRYSPDVRLTPARIASITYFESPDAPGQARRMEDLPLDLQQRIDAEAKQQCKDEQGRAWPLPSCVDCGRFDCGC